MNFITPSDLPSVPEGKTGWPWNMGDVPVAADFETFPKWPKITVVTPSFNQAEYLEQTIRSVLLQSYPNIEYVIIDGGSTDGSVAIIEKYSPWLTHWESKPDRGQSDAINKGLHKASGEIQCWINSDDYFAPNAFHQVATEFSRSPEIQWMIGAATLLFENGDQQLRQARQLTKDELLHWTKVNWFCQQATFWRTSLIRSAGLLDESMHYLMDWNLWLRFYAIATPTIIEQPLAYYRFHDSAKCMTGDEPLLIEEVKFVMKLCEAPKGSLYYAYREPARRMLSDLLKPILQTRANQPPNLELYGSLDLLCEIVRRTARRILPDRTGK